jgi:hypothetical protein
VDWRTPVAEPFFAATHAHPMGLTSRRRYHWARGRVSDYWDEVFDLDVLQGRAALDDQSAFIASLGSARSDRMRDAYVRALRAAQLRGSMGRVGACADNAAMESFFSLLQKNVLNRRRWRTREELRLAIVTWIERTYHRRRRQDALGRLTPIEYETITQAAYAA